MERTAAITPSQETSPKSEFESDNLARVRGLVVQYQTLTTPTR